MHTASGSALARAALAGNPSDGYGGATLAVALRNYAAKVELRPSAELRVDPPNLLIKATVSRFARDHDPGAAHVHVRWTTTIPREVGLGGSSAIVTATLRALLGLHALDLPPDRLADAALAVEVAELGIAAGLQDRVAQAYGGLTFMDFAGRRRPVYESLAPGLLPGLFVAFHPDTGSSSGTVHRELRHRFDRGDPEILAAMAELADQARSARSALAAGDLPGFTQSIDATFDLRRRILPLDPRHVAMVAAARGAGACANYTGSGGAIVGAWGPRPESVRAALRRLGARCASAIVA